MYFQGGGKEERNDGEKEIEGEEKTQVGVSTMYIDHGYFIFSFETFFGQFVDI